MRGEPQDKARLSLALDRAWKRRAEKCAARTKMSMSLIAQVAVEAAVEAIERADFRVVAPLEFEVTYIPAKNHRMQTLSEISLTEQDRLRLIEMEKERTSARHPRREK